MTLLYIDESSTQRFDPNFIHPDPPFHELPSSEALDIPILAAWIRHVWSLPYMPAEFYFKFYGPF